MMEHPRPDSTTTRPGAGIRRTIVLVGLMGARKSTVGRRLASMLRRSFVDADEAIDVAALVTTSSWSGTRPDGQQHTENRPAIGVRVSDPGTGMAPHDLARIFERFYRADRARSVPGSGLGMSLVKEIVELHGGRIDVESEPGQGTQVTLWWPVPRHDVGGASDSSGMLHR